MLQVLPAYGTLFETIAPGMTLQVLPASSSAALGESLTWTLSNARRAAQHLDALLRLQTRSLLRLRSPGLKL